MTKKVNITAEAGADVQTVSKAVFRKLKQERQKQHITLDELSRRLGVSKRMVVAIEQCDANPSIAIRCKAAAALGLSVADVVNVSDIPSAHFIHSQDMPTLWSVPQGGSARLLAGTSGPNMIKLWRWKIHPGETFLSSGHPPGTTELFHVQTGTLHFKVGEAELIVSKGCTAIAKTDLPHAYSNQVRSKLVFTMSITELHQLSVKGSARSYFPVPAMLHTVTP